MALQVIAFRTLLSWWVSALLESDKALKEYARAWKEKNLDRYLECQRVWQQKNPDKVKANGQRWLEKNRTKKIASRVEWRKNNLEKDRATRRAWDKKKRKENPGFKLRQNLAVRVRKVLKGINKSKTTVLLIGCSILELKERLERGFKPGMTWKNYGPVWHVDHIKPCAKFDLSIPEQQMKCFHYSNLQPLFASENIRKGDK